MFMIKKKLSSQKAVSMAEMLLAMLILLLVSQGLAFGINVAVRQYKQSIQLSEAQELYGDIKRILTNELRYTNEERLELDSGADENGYQKVERFYSITYAIKDYPTSLVALEEDGQDGWKEADQGELAMGNQGEYNRILGSASYPNGMQARASIAYKQSQKMFKVNIIIYSDKKKELINEDFNVRLLSQTDS